MGFFSKFRTGRTAAKKSAERATALAQELGNEHLASQREFGQQIGDMTQPAIQQGQDAANMLSGFYGTQQGQQQFVDQARQSPLYNSMIDEGAQQIGRYASATGGVRGGNINESLASNSQNVLNSIINQRLQGLGNVANYGMQNQGNYLNATANNLNGQGQTLSGITGASMAEASNKANSAAGMTGLYGSLIGSGISAASSAFGAPGITEYAGVV